MPKLDLVFFDAGGGHRAAATALKLSLEQQFPAWDVRLMNLQETLDELDVIRRVSGVRMQDVYNQLLRKGWTLGSELLIGPMHLLIRLNHPAMVRSLAERWGNDAPDLLVSLVPNFNRVLFEGYRRVKPNGQMVTILTDLADFPPHFWIEQQDQWFVCGTQRAVDQAVAAGHPAPYSRRGPGPVFTPKPDVVHAGGGVHAVWARGETSLNVLAPSAAMSQGFGTSYAAPMITAMAGNVWDSLAGREGFTASASMVKALVIVCQFPFPLQHVNFYIALTIHSRREHF